MSEVIDLFWWQRDVIRQQKLIADKKRQLWVLIDLKNFSHWEITQKLFDTDIKTVIWISIEHLDLLIRDYLYTKLKDAGKYLDERIYLCSSYLQELLISFLMFDKRWKEILNSPYVIDWMNQWDFQMAWDTAVFWYLFFYKKRKNTLSRDDYLQLASNSYFSWYDKSKSANVGILLSELLPMFLSMIQNFETELLKRRLKLL